MKILATSDLHLTLSDPSKDMSKFGETWDDHIEKIKVGWAKVVRPEDIVIIAGDVSWATKIEQAHTDFKFIDRELPGKKLVTIGNHDYWYQTASKSNTWFFDNYKSMVPLVRDYINIYDDIAVCAVRGYMNENHPEFKDEYRKSYLRECNRLEATLLKIPQTFDNIIVVTHYPPIHKGYTDGENKAMEVMLKYKVTNCVYGHLHAEATEDAVIGTHKDIKFQFVAGDSHNFEPQIIVDDV